MEDFKKNVKDWKVGDTLKHTHPINGTVTIKKIESKSELFIIKMFGSSAVRIKKI